MAKKRQVQSKHVFFVGSLLHQDPAEYQAICCAMTGTVIGHRGKDLFTTPEVEEVKEDEEPIKDDNQLKMF